MLKTHNRGRAQGSTPVMPHLSNAQSSANDCLRVCACVCACCVCVVCARAHMQAVTSLRQPVLRVLCCDKSDATGATSVVLCCTTGVMRHAVCYRGEAVKETGGRGCRASCGTNQNPLRTVTSPQPPPRNRRYDGCPVMKTDSSQLG